MHVCSFLSRVEDEFTNQILLEELCDVPPDALFIICENKVTLLSDLLVVSDLTVVLTVSDLTYFHWFLQ